MADNIAVTPGSGATVAADDIGGVLFQRVKLALGADGTGVDASAGAGAVGTGVQRMTLASDDPGVALLTTIDADTSALALVDFATESGGNLDAAVALLTTIDADTSALAVVDFATESGGNLDAITAAVQHADPTVIGEYETVAASQTAQALGGTGATGDFIAGVLVIPETAVPGVVTLLDNAISIPLFVGGASSVIDLKPFYIELGLVSVSGAWKLTTGANVSAIGIGNFTA